MISISHRGNINGRIIERENHPEYIIEALKFGYDVEIDLWIDDGKMVLGHDNPQYEIDKRFLINKGLWIHTKNFEAFESLIESNQRYFWHTDEDLVLTSKKDIWIYPGKKLLKNSVAVLPEITNYSIEDLRNCSGICSDNISFYKNIN